MDKARRSALRLLAGGAVLGASSACPSPLLAATIKRATAALLVPLTGEHARVGLSMQRAALLAEKDTGRLLVIDSAGKGGAAAAARRAVSGGAKLILGPIFSAEVRPVLTAVAGKVPVVAFSNDASLADSGVFLLGLTPGQLVSALLSYARSRGVRSIAIVSSTSAWSRQAAAAAERAATTLGLSVGGAAPDAVLVTDRAAPRPAASQLLLATEALDPNPAGLNGAWCVAPDPEAFGAFASAFETANGGSAGVLAALAYDATVMAGQLGTTGRMSRDGLLSPDGFSGATGAWRFRADGTAERTLTILAAGPDGYSPVATARGA